MTTEIREEDRETRRKLMICFVMNMNSEVDRLYADRKDGGKGLRAAEDVVEQECVMIANYTRTEDGLSGSWITTQ